MKVGKKIQKAAIEIGINQAELARRIGMERVWLNKIINGKVNPTVTTLQKIARALGKSLEYFDENYDPLRVKEEPIPHGYRRFPLLAHVPAGTKRWVEDDIHEWIEIPVAFVGKYQQMFLIKADGDSMEGAGILDGDLVAVACDKEVTNGSIVIVRVDDESVIRRYRKLKDKIRLEPANSKYTSEEYDSKHEVDIKGVVVWAGRKFT